MAQFASLWVERILRSSPTDGERAINIVASYLGIWRVSRSWRACVCGCGGCEANAALPCVCESTEKEECEVRATARYLITGGAGFIGSHVADALTARDDAVAILDDFSTGRRANVERLVASGCGRTGRGMRHRLRARGRTDGRLRSLSPSRLDGWRPPGRRLPARDASTDRSWGRRGDLGRGLPGQARPVRVDLRGLRQELERTAERGLGSNARLEPEEPMVVRDRQVLRRGDRTRLSP